MMRTAPHHHPCQTCGAKTECGGTWEQNYDGYPDVTCPEFHVVGGLLNPDFTCPDCSARELAQHRPMTMDDVIGAIGRERAAWVEVRATGEQAILVRAGRTGDAVLIRYVDPRGGYHWTSANSLRRREDLDDGQEPTWLQQARVSPRPPAVLWDVLNMSAVKAEARAAADALLGDAAARDRAAAFDTDADGRVL